MVNANYLQHYGVLGMKWGQHRYRHYTNKVNKLSAKRKEAYNTKGAASSKYRMASKKLFIQKSKMKLAKARLNNDSVEKAIQKSNIWEGKRLIKYGGSNYDTDYRTYRSVYGPKLSRKEKEAINVNENKYGDRKRKIKLAKALALTTVGAGALMAGKAYISKKALSFISGETLSGGNIGNMINLGEEYIRDIL